MGRRQKITIDITLRCQTAPEFLAFRQALRLLLFELAKQHLRQQRLISGEPHGQSAH